MPIPSTLPLWQGFGFMPWGPYLSSCTWRWSIHLRDRLRNWWGANPWPCNAWWPQLGIRSGVSPRPPQRGTYSNQGCWSRPWGQWQKGLSTSSWEKLLLATMRRNSSRSEFSCLLKRRKSWYIFLEKNIDVFAWSAYEAPRVDLDFICHYLNVNPSVLPKKQPPRCSSKEHSDAIKDEVLKLKLAGAIKEVFYS